MLGLARIWRTRAIWLGLAGLGCALYGQKLVADGKEQAVVSSIHWYTAGIILVIIAWAGTYKNRSLLRLPGPSAQASNAQAGAEPSTQEAHPGWRTRLPGWARSFLRLGSGQAWRYSLAFAALGLNLFSVSQLRADYYSSVGGWGWLASLALLLVAFIGHHPDPGIDADAGVRDVEDRTDLHIPRNVEIAIFVAIFVLALALRLYRLGDWLTGVHADEGQAGEYVLKVLGGEPASPFLTGWMNQPNIYYWGVALTMKVFGTDLFGLRMYAMIVGSLMIVPFYLLARLLFGIRAAIIAGVLLAVSAIAVQVSKEEFSNSTTPFFLVTGFYFLFRGLRTRRTLDFVLAGYAHLLSLYFYNGGRLAPLLLMLVLAYLFVLMPLVRLPGAYRSIFRQNPDRGRSKALSGALQIQAHAILHYSVQILVLLLACVCIISPWLSYYVDHRAQMDMRANDVLIFNMPDRMASRYDVTHDPLYIGLRIPGDKDLYPLLPVTFEKTPASIMLGTDGFWPLVLWRQTAATLSIITYRTDMSSVYALAQGPIDRPIEAALIVLGLAWALWRWRDARMAVLAMWFWLTIFIGGTLTDEAPYMPRLVGIIPLLALFAAIPLNKLAAEFAGLLSRWGRRRFNVGARLQLGQLLGTSVLIGLLVLLGIQNYDTYFVQHIDLAPFRDVSAQTLFVQQMNQEALARGRPKPTYYPFGMHYVDWSYGTNRFLNRGTTGADLANPSDDLPLLDLSDGDSVFMIWKLDKDYLLPVVKSYYPGGEEGDFAFGPPNDDTYQFTYYLVSKQQVDATRVSKATYLPATGTAINRDEPGIGTTGAAPGNLTYPAQASWQTSLMAPAFARYSFRLTGTGGRLVIDGVNVLTTSSGWEGEGDIILARGLHDVQVTAEMRSNSDKVALTWSAGGSDFQAIGRNYLWSGAGRGLTAEVLQSSTPIPARNGGNVPTQIVQRRVDALLSFHNAPEVLAKSVPLSASWTGELAISQAGRYGFDLFTAGTGELRIDSSTVIEKSQRTRDPNSSRGEIDLSAGLHQFYLTYNWAEVPGDLDVYWTPPGGQEAVLPFDVLHTSGGAWPPGTIQEPTQYKLPVDTSAESGSH